MQHTMLVVKLRRAVGADLVPINKVAIGKGNLMLGGAVTGVALVVLRNMDKRTETFEGTGCVEEPSGVV
jgi:hypothetical protein